MKKVLLALAALVSMISTSCAPKTQEADIKIMSFNIRNGQKDDGENSWEFRMDAVVEMLTEAVPDCFGVQEAYDFQRDYLLANMPSYSCIGCGREDGSDEGEHNCIFWNVERFVLQEGGNFWLSETPDVPSKGWDGKYPRIATWVRLVDSDTGKEFFIVNTHLDHKGVQARRNSIDLIIEKVAAMNPDGHPLILMGDFNLEDDDQIVKYFDTRMHNARNEAASSDRHASFNGWGDPEKESIIDYIYYNGFSKCIKFETVLGEWCGRSIISDHNAISAYLKY